MSTELPPEHFAESEQAERALFGACILAPSQLDEVAELVGPQCFHDSELGAAFGLLSDLQAAGKPVADLTLLVGELRKAGLLEPIGGAAFIAEASNQALAHNAKWYAAQVREYSHRRELHAAFMRGVSELKQGKRNAVEVAEQTEAKIQAAQHSEATDVQTLDSVLGHAIDEVRTAKSRGCSLGLATGLEILDRETGGFFPGELTILAARPSIGKTALAIELAARVAKPSTGKANRVLFVSLEMNGEALAHRFLARQTGIAARKIQSAELGQAELDRLEQARAELRELGLKALVSTRATLARIRARARVLMAQGGIDLLIIDYLGLIQADGRQSPYERISGLSRELKQLAVELNRPVLCLAQLNRAAAQSGGPPTLEHLRDSGAIEQDADNVWLLHRRDREATETLLIVAKQRQGAVGTIELEFDPVRTSFDVPRIQNADRRLGHSRSATY